MSCLVERNTEGKVIAVKLDSNNVKQTVKSKSGVDFVFEQNTELASIGTQKEYSQYLENIFPNSKRKEIFYHGTFDSSNKETYFREGVEESDLRTWNFFYNDLPSALNIGMNPYAVMLDFSADINSTEGEYKNVLTNQTADSAIIYESNATSDEYAVKNRSQIHILGSQSDIEGFRNFVSANLESENSSTNSELFNNILTMPFIDDRTALNMYMSTLTDKFKAKFSNSPMLTNELGEPKLFFKTGDGFVYNNYKDALKNRISGIIEVGFIHTNDVEINSELFNTLNNDLVVDNSQFTVKYKLNNNEAFDTFIEINSSTDKSKYEGMINNLILEEVLSPERILMDGNLYYKGAGELGSTIMLTSQVVRDEFVRAFGRESVVRLENGYLQLEKINNNNVIELVDKNGKSSTIDLQEAEIQLLKDKQKLEKRDSNFIELLYTIVRKKFNIFSGELNTIPEKSEQELSLKLVKVLNSLGTKVTSMSNYLTNYNTKNNTDPSAEALADIANNVIAFAEGQDNIENFTEETAHFIIEAYTNQQEIEDALLEIETTDEWNQYNKIYYDIYSKTYSGEQLDEIVRREILGKILSKRIQDKFNQIDSLTNKLRTIFNKFFNYVRQFINPTVKKNLQDVVDDLAEKVINEEIEEYISNEDFESTPFIFYSLNDKRTIATLMQGKQLLEKRLNDLKAIKSPKIAGQVSLLNDLNRAMNNNEELTAIQLIKASSESLYKDLEKKLVNGVAWDYNDIKFYNDLTTQNTNLLETSREILNSTIYEDELMEKKRTFTIDQINDLINRISILKGKANVKEQNSFDFFVEKLTNQYTLTEKQKEEVKDLLNKEFKEISWFQANFASLEHAREPILNMLGIIIRQNNFKADRKMQKIGNPVLMLSDEQKWSQKDFEGLMEYDEKGIPTGYFISPEYNGKYQKEKKLAIVNAYKEVFNLPNLTVEEYDKQMTPNSKRTLKTISEIYDVTDKKFSVIERDKFDNLMNNFRRENNENKYNEAYLQKRATLLDTLKIGKSTQTFLSSISSERGSILSKYKNKDGILDWSDISEYDRSLLDELEERRKGAKFIIDPSTGERKEGESLRIAEDLQKLDRYYQEQDKNTLGIRPEFFNKLKEIVKQSGNKEGFLWFTKNAGLRFNNKFWDNLSNRESITKRIDKIIMSNSDLKDNINDYNSLVENNGKLKTLLEKKSDILKQFQHSIDPSEIDTNNMYLITKNILKQTEEELQDIFSNINNILYKYDENTINENITENTVNKSYFKELKESNLSEYKFILENVTSKDYDKIEGLRILLTNIKNNQYNVSISSTYRNYLETLIGINDITVNDVKNYMSNSNISVEKLSIDYGKNKLLPYFKRFAPKGYNELVENLQNGTTSILDVLSDINNNKELGQFLELDTKFSWKEDITDNDILNPNYIENFEGGYEQPKWSKYGNSNFFKELGFDENKYRNGEGLHLIDTNNRKGVIYKNLIDLKKIGLESLNEYGRENLYKLPQYSKGEYQKMEAFVKKNPGKTLINTFKDLTQNRTDTLEFGERLGLDDDVKGEVRIIPKYGIRDLEEKSDISSELLHTTLKFVHDALLYEQKLNTISDVNILEQELESKIKKAGINFSENKTLKTFKNFMDAYFHGVQRTRQFWIHLPNGKRIDISKLVMQFDKWVRSVNIGFSFFVAATSLTTAEVNLRIESIVGDYINHNSVTFAGKEFLTLAPKTFTDIGQYNKKSKLYLLGEAMGIHNFAEKTASSNYSPYLRSLNGLPHKMSEMANFPIVNRIMIAVLDSHRLVDGKVMDFKVFKEFNKDLNLTKKELDAKWNTHRNNSFYNMLEIKPDNTIGFKQEFVEQVGEEYLENQLNLVRNKVISTNSSVDSVVSPEDKSVATRDFLMSFMTAHRGWLSIGVSRKTKHRQFNFVTGQVEEGQYVSVANLFSSVAKDLNEKGFKNMIKVLKENYNKMSDFERRNVKRTLVELGTYVALLGLGVLVVGIADDDDNKDLWALQTASYIYMRTVNEIGSMQAPMGLLNLIDVAQSPFIALNNIKQMTQSNALSFDPVATGEYQGMPKILKTGIKQTYLRHWYEVSSAETVRKKRQYFTNVLNSEVLIGLQSKSKKEKEEEESNK